MDLLKVPRFPYQKRLRNKGYLNLATEVLKDFSPGVFSRHYVNHIKNLEQRKFRADIFLFSKVTLKATAVNSDSWPEACPLQLS